jgi:hypothetical protein
LLPALEGKSGSVSDLRMPLAGLVLRRASVGFLQINHGSPAMHPDLDPLTKGEHVSAAELARHNALRDEAGVALQRVMCGRFAKSFGFVGRSETGKRRLLDRVQLDAEQMGALTVPIEEPRSRSLPALLAPPLRIVLQTLSKSQAAGDRASRALRALAGFTQTHTGRFNDIAAAHDEPTEPEFADNGDLETDLVVLLEAAGEAAAADGRALVLLFNELQSLERGPLAALIAALHRRSQLTFPVLLIATGLPEVRGQMGSAKSYAERFFDYPPLAPGA